MTQWRLNNTDFCNQLPDELILHIFSYLDLPSLIHVQRASRRFLHLGRDANIWKQLCFADSRAEAQRKRQLLFPTSTVTELNALRHTINSLSGGTNDNATSTDAARISKDARIRALANWDPTYANERIDFYQEYIHRHAPIAPINWLRLPLVPLTGSSVAHEATGLGTIRHLSLIHISEPTRPY